MRIGGRPGLARLARSRRATREEYGRAGEGPWSPRAAAAGFLGMDGIETLAEIRKLDPDVQVILLTGHATVQVSIDARKLGAADLLRKPAAFPEALERIRAAGAEHSVLPARRTQDEVDEIL